MIAFVKLKIFEGFIIPYNLNLKYSYPHTQSIQIIKTLNHLFDFPQSNQQERKKRLSFSFPSVKALVDLLGSLACVVGNIYSPKIHRVCIYITLPPGPCLLAYLSILNCPLSVCLK